ncbi:HMA2 domain-containing protein [Vibrio neonatus]|uniref:HMA2 domain-containing protein n=1 Tax=Vibrio neonatus TaxID=278860 RepID=UPI0021C3DFA1|nr:cation transporter [Vibrio neonatus]
MNQYVSRVLKLRKWVKISHHIPGRVRLKYKLGIIAQLSTFKSQDIEKALQSVPAFKNYQLNPKTGSILIEYDPIAIEPDWIESLFSDNESDVEAACHKIAERVNNSGDC